MPAEALIERYRDAGLALLPPGRAIAKRLGSNVARLLEGIAVEFARLEENAEIITRNSVPGNAVELIEDWEEALGLPGACVETPSTVLADRQGAVVVKIKGRTSHAEAAFLAAATALGYTDVEFERFPPFSVGSSAMGDALYGDEWANVVRAHVLVGDQTADEQLVCTFTDELRRSHGFIDVIMEGALGATRTNVLLYNTANNLGADMVLASVAAFTVNYTGHVSIQVTIDNGTDGLAPTDTPVGVWRIYASSDSVNFSEIADVSPATDIADELDKIAPNGNNVVNAYAVFENFPGTAGKIVYDRTSGGGTNATAKVRVTTF